MSTISTKPVYKVAGKEGLFAVVARGKKNTRVQPVNGGDSFLVENANLAEVTPTVVEPAPVVPPAVVTAPTAPITPPATQQAPVNGGAAAALAAAKKATDAKKKNGDRILVSTPEMEALADQVITQKKATDEADRAWETLRKDFASRVDTLRTTTVSTDPSRYTKTVEIERGDHKVQASFWSHQGKIDEANEPALREVFGPAYDKLFTKKRTLVISDKITGDESKLTELVDQLVALMGVDRFAQVFQFTSEIVPTTDADRQQFDLTGEQRTQFNNLGLTQRIVVQVR